VSERGYQRAGLLLWLVAWVVVSILVADNTAAHSVTPVFHLAVQRWWAHAPLYADVRGFHYLPQFALLFTPFHLIPSPLGDIVWRLASVSICVYGIWAIVARLRPAYPGRFFFYSCLLALPPCLGAVRNGQTNLAFGGLSLLVASLLAGSQWWQAAVCLAVLVTIKPLGLVLLALAAAVYPPLRTRVVVALAALAVLPFLFGPAAYAAAQYRNAFHHLVGLSGTAEHRFADLAGLLGRIGVEPSAGLSLGIRALAGVATLLLAVVAASTGSGARRALTLVLLAATYLMLFNPMTEKNSYAIIAPPLAVGALCCLSAPRFARFGWTFGFVLVSIGVFPELFSRIDRNFGLWWDPLMMLVVFGLLAWRVLRREPVFPKDALERV
jgi:alpha-1,2-mannosyltransferase